jgi:hypothetical protein
MFNIHIHAEAKVWALDPLVDGECNSHFEYSMGPWVVAVIVTTIFLQNYLGCRCEELIPYP